MIVDKLAIFVIVLPMLSSAIAGFYGHRYIAKYVGFLTAFFIGINALISIILFSYIVNTGSIINFKFLYWISSGNVEVHWGILIDGVTVIMLLVVNIISFLVHLYSIEYMAYDPNLSRFMSYLSLFTFFMLMLVTADNFLQMFLGWEGVGIASYLLINFWYTRVQANKSALKAIIVNRIGDFFLSLGIAIIFYVFKTVDFSTVFALVPLQSTESFNFVAFEVNKITFIGLMLLFGAVGKSAQLGLHTWLPDAMEGPTPVSALIHAATMVTAGVFVLIRSSPLLEYSSSVLLVMTLFGGLTAFFAATVGIFQNDLKKVIAYSTCSQLGYMVFAAGLSGYAVSMFHLMNHAFFKALLFLSAGSVIHAMSDEQDMRKMGGLARLLPITYIMMLLGSLALMGFPFLSGFYSKDVILEFAFSDFYVSGTVIFWLGTITAGFTAFYSIRSLYLTFLVKTNAYKPIVKNVHESPVFMLVPLFVLAVGSIFSGFLMRDMLIGVGTNFWGNSILVLPSNVRILDSEYEYFLNKLIPTAFSFVGAFLSFLIYNNLYNILVVLNNLSIIRKIYRFFNKKWYFDVIYNSFIVKSLLFLGYKVTFKFLDRGIIEWIGPFGLTKLAKSISQRVSGLQTGYIYHYCFLIIFGIIIMMGLISFFFVIKWIGWSSLFCYIIITLWVVNININQ